MTTPKDKLVAEMRAEVARVEKGAHLPPECAPEVPTWLVEQWADQVAALPVAPEWLPIERAPSDGVHVRGLWVTIKRAGKPGEREWREYVGRMDDGRFVDPEYGEDFGWEAGDFDAWLRLPAPPAAPLAAAQGEADNG